MPTARYAGILGLMAAATLVFACLTVAAPLAVYTVTLALFGAPHVLSELRYVDRRFGRHISRALLATIFALLALVAVTRATVVFHVLPARIELRLELSIVALLALSVASGSAWRRAVALFVALALGTATALDPFDTAVTFSVLHNLTPLGFLWQLTRGGRRVRAILPALLGLLALPVFVATGFPRQILSKIGLSDVDPLGAGPLTEHLFVYIPNCLLGNSHAIDFFVASVVAQGGHYFSVIAVLPLLLGRIEPRACGIVPWPPGKWFYLALGAFAAAVLGGFCTEFAEARTFYGIFASIHAWLEIPILILALTGSDQRMMNNPARQDAELASKEISVAR